MKGKVYAVLRVMTSLFFMGLLFYLAKDRLGLTIEMMKKTDSFLFLFSCVIFILSMTIMAVRLKVILYAQGLFLRFSETTYLTFIGLFFNNFLPTAVGGDVVKAYYASKKTDNKLNSFVSVFMDRFTGFLSLFILAGISLIFSYTHIKEKNVIWVTVVTLFLLLIVLTLFFNKKFAGIFSPLMNFIQHLNVKEKIEKIYDTIHAFKDKKTQIFQAILISAVAQITGFSTIYLLSKGMGVFIPIKMVFLLMPLVSIVSMLPSINGLGVRESAIYFLFGPYIGHKNALALSFLWLFMLFLVSVIGGITYLLGMRYKEVVK